MGFGLILAGMGKGIAEAGSTYGNMMFKAAESELSDKRAQQRAEALERLKFQMQEDQAKKDADVLNQAQTAAAAAGKARSAAQLEAESGRLAEHAGTVKGDAPAMTQDEIKRHLETLSPSERNAIAKTGLVGEAMSKPRQELQGMEDVIDAARKGGGSSNLIKSLQESKRERLKEIAQEAKEEGEKAERQLNRDREDRRDREARDRARYQDRMADAADRRAAAAEARANRDPRDPSNKPATTADMQRQVTFVRDQIATELGSPKSELNTAIAATKRKAAAGDAKAKEKLEIIQPYLDELDELGTRLKQFKNPPAQPAAPPAAGSSASGAPAAAPAEKANNNTTPPKIDQVKGAPAGSAVGAFVSGKGWEIKDKSGKLIGYTK